MSVNLFLYHYHMRAVSFYANGYPRGYMKFMDY